MRNPLRIHCLLLLLLLLHLLLAAVGAQQTHIKLEQGDLIGLKVFPDGTRTAVYAFLGIPYAQPPVAELRFAPAKASLNWNRTLQATTMRPICPQLSNTIYDESSEGGGIPSAAQTDEDCLYLNIWTPETGLRYGKLPIAVIVTGEEFAYDWPRNRINGLDLAGEGIVVISVQYRNNIYGWLGLGEGHRQLPGNYGLTDVRMAIKWIQRNADAFGGNPDQITLLGHGSGGAALVLATALEDSNLLKQLVLMSPGPVLRSLGSGHDQRVVETGRQLIQKLGCQFEEAQRRQLLGCLRRTSQEDLLRAYESVYNHGNGSYQLGVILWRGLEERLRNQTLPPLLLGITSNEGAFLQDYWLDVAREGQLALQEYINHTVLPNVLRSLEAAGGEEGGSQLAAIKWRYFNGVPERGGSVIHLLSGMQRLLSETLYELPFFRLLDMLNGSTSYAYVFDQAHSMDMRGRKNLFAGASHSSDLPLLLGPSLFQQIARRRFSGEEEQLCRKLRGAFANFLKSGNPTPGRIYDAWLPYSRQSPFIYSLGEQQAKPIQSGGLDEAEIDKLLRGETSAGIDRSLSRTNRHDTYRAGASNSYTASNQQDSGFANHLQRVYGFWQVLLPLEQDNEFRGGALGQRVRLLEAHADAARYRQGFYAMLGLVCLLLACLCLCVYLLKRNPDPLRRRNASSATDCYCL
ncbi:cocaine esterase [Drosophila guanche]|uniref:Blast:Cocaine esterase n=2 Tax=Drosophila guanche TaxID=7266 RepID=A0A3B0J6A3_DROGU|nr:cocaine esterase [Drosophila guanche]SPP75302.1 blast:Cocaine esterase [Drosophila guanche]